MTSGPAIKLTLRGSYSFLLLIVVMFYAGELVWKERSAKLNEVVDAMPVANRAGGIVVGKFGTASVSYEELFA